MRLGIRARVQTRDARNDPPSRDGDVFARKLPNELALSERTFSTTQHPVDL